MARCARHDTIAVAIVVAIFAVVAFGFGAIVVDLGYARMVKGQAQDAADSAALAAAAALSDGGLLGRRFYVVYASKLKAKQILDVEPAGWSGCVDPGRLTEPAPGVPCVSFDAEQDDNPREVRVRVPDAPPYSFFGRDLRLQRHRDLCFGGGQPRTCYIHTRVCNMHTLHRRAGRCRPYRDCLS